MVRLLFWFLGSWFRSQNDLALEKVALRHQLASFKQRRPRPTLTDADRAFLRKTRPGGHCASAENCSCSGYDVSERTVPRYLPKRPPDQEKIRQWKTFLENHREVIASMDLFTIPLATSIK